MEAALTTKAPEKKAAQPALDASPESSATVEREQGAAAGMPVYLSFAKASPGDSRRNHHQVQAKLAVNQPGDAFEQEADRVAERITSAHAAPVHATPAIQRSCCAGGASCPKCQEETQIQRKGNDSSGEARPAVPANFLNKLGSGRPLDHATRGFMESRFGGNLDHVRVHTDSSANESAKSINARAFTFGSNVVFGSGQYNPQSTEGRKLLAHELTHVIQQSGSASHHYQSHGDSKPDATSDNASEKTSRVSPATSPATGGVIQRSALDPANEMAWSFLGGKGEKYRDVFLDTLSAAPEASLKTTAEIEKSGPPSTDEQKKLFEQRVRALIRLTALGAMASHRASITSKRAEMLGQARISGKADKKPGEAESGKPQALTAQAVRAAAQEIYELNNLKQEIEGYRDNLKVVEAQVIISMRTMGRIEGWLTDIRENARAYQSAKISRYLTNAAQGLGRQHFKNLDEVAPFIWAVAKNLKEWRQGQVDGVDAGLGYLFESFPFFAQLEASDVVEGERKAYEASKGAFANRSVPPPSSQYAKNDEVLMDAVRKAYDTLVGNIDESIATIGSGDIDPYDLPLAVKVVRDSLSPELRKPMDDLLQAHEVKKFWQSMALTIIQAAVIFIPVVGPFIAAGIGAITIGSEIESMLDRDVLASASTSPDKTMLGVSGPSKFEWAMRAVEIALTLADLRAGWHQINARRPKFDVTPEGPAVSPAKKGSTAPKEEGAPALKGKGEPTAARVNAEGQPIKPGEPHAGEPPAGKSGANPRAKTADVKVVGGGPTADGQHRLQVLSDGTIGRCTDYCTRLADQFSDVLAKRTDMRGDLDAIKSLHDEILAKEGKEAAAAFAYQEGKGIELKLQRLRQEIAREKELAKEAPRWAEVGGQEKWVTPRKGVEPPKPWALEKPNLPSPSALERESIEKYQKALAEYQSARLNGNGERMAKANAELDRIEALAGNPTSAEGVYLEGHIASLRDARARLRAEPGSAMAGRPSMPVGEKGIDVVGMNATDLPAATGGQVRTPRSAALGRMEGRSFSELEGMMGRPSQYDASRRRITWILEDGSMVHLDMPGSGAVESKVFEVSRRPHVARTMPPPYSAYEISDLGILVPARSTPSHIPVSVSPEELARVEAMFPRQ